MAQEKTAPKKLKLNNLSVVELDSGRTYLGVLDEANSAIVNALELLHGSGVNRPVFESYLKERNMGNLQTRKFSAVTGYAVVSLTAEQEAEWAHIQGMFAMAQKHAKAYNENTCFSQLFSKK